MGLEAIQAEIPQSTGNIASEAAAVDAASPSATPEQQRISKHFAVLSRKEKALFREREQLKAEKTQLLAERQRVSEIEARYATKPATPKEALERYGFSYRDATEYELNDGAPTAEHIARQAQDEIKQFREEQAQKERQQLEEQARRLQQEQVEVIHQVKDEIKEIIKDNPEKYELTALQEDGAEIVYSIMEQDFAKTGKLRSVPEYANIAEDFLEKYMAKLQATKKFAKTRTPGDPPKPESGFRSQTPQTAPRRTLDNQATSSSATLVKSSSLEADRLKRAMAALG